MIRKIIISVLASIILLFNAAGMSGASASSLSQSLPPIAYQLSWLVDQRMVEMVITYNPLDQSDPWKLYDPKAPDYANDLRELERGRGYWVKVSMTVLGAGQYYSSTVFWSGWNLIGWMGEPAPTPTP